MASRTNIALGLAFTLLAAGALLTAVAISNTRHPAPPSFPAGPSAVASPASSPSSRPDAVRDMPLPRVDHRIVGPGPSAIPSAVTSNADLQAWVSAPQTWKVLPGNLRVELDALDEPTYLAFTPSPTTFDDFRNSAEALFQNPVSLLVGPKARRILKDREGRLWISWRGDRLFCYDGKTWAESRSSDSQGATANMSVPAQTRPATRPIADVLEFTTSAFEDRAGNLHFLVGSQRGGHGGVHTRWADGHWSFYPLELNGAGTFQRWRFCQLADDRILAAGIYRSFSRVESNQLLIFDGKSWTAQTLYCRNPAHRVSHIRPFADGQLLVSCAPAPHVWQTTLPQAILAPPAQSAQTVLQQLTNPSPEIRSAAREKAKGLGNTLSAGLAKIRADPNVSAEVKQEIAVLLAASPFTDPPKSPMSFGAFHVAEARPIDDASSDRVVLRVRGVAHENSLLNLQQTGLLERQADGLWTFRALPPVSDHDPVPLDLDMAHEFPDGGFLLRDGRELTRELVLTDRVPTGVTPPALDFVDAHGRAYFSGGLVFDHTFPLALAPEEERLPLVGFLREPQSAAAWAVDRSKQPQELIELTDKPFIGLPRFMAWGPDAKIDSLLTVGKGVIVHLDEPSHNALGPDEPCTFWWTGDTWVVGRGLVRFIHQHAPELARVASPMQDMSAGPLALAGDGNGGLWLRWTRFRTRSTRDDDPTGRPPFAIPQILEHFDGKTWHDVQKELGLDLTLPNAPIHTADNGRSMLLAIGHGTEVRKVIYEKGKGYRLGPGITSPFVWPIIGFQPVVGRAGTLWLVTRTGFALKSDDGGLALTAQPPPLLEDADGNVWSYQRHGLEGKTKTGEIIPAVGVPALQALLPWDKDTYLGIGFNEAVKLGLRKAAAGKRELVVLATFPWGTARNSLENTYFDPAAGQLWLSDKAGRVSRIRFPAAFTQAAAPPENPEPAQPR